MVHTERLFIEKTLGSLSRYLSIRTMYRDTKQTAIISDDGEYRYKLSRTWDSNKSTVAFIMLNPSTADGSEDDPTIRRCIGYAKRWGFGKLIVGNLFALRSTGPKMLEEHNDPVGPDNDAHIQEISTESDKVIAAWGHRGGYMNRGEAVVKLIDEDLFAIGTTKDGHPWHPLRKPKDAQPERWPEDNKYLQMI